MRWALLVAALIAAPVAVAADYDAALAARLGADERGMRMYTLVILKTGPRSDLPKDEQERLFQGHMANIKRLTAEGKLIVAGPLAANAQNYRGIFVFNIAKRDDAVALLKTDPAVAAGVFAYEIYGWYGSAAVMEIPAIHPRIDKTQQ
jgi:uncharacterized protein